MLAWRKRPRIVLFDRRGKALSFYSVPVTPKEEIMESVTALHRFQVENLKIEIYPDGEALGEAAAQDAAEALKQLGQSSDEFGVIFATGASQLNTLHTLTALPGLPWSKIRGFHMDEYIGMAPENRASFRRYLRENLSGKVSMKEFSEIDGTASDIAALCSAYQTKLRAANPQLCLLGIGENGHIAFNDPAEADFVDPVDLKVVQLDEPCRQQQFAEGWFETFNDVPTQAITVTIPALFRVPKLILSVPGTRKAEIVRSILTEPISTEYPATIMRRHPNATLYLDAESAEQIQDMLA
jgi:glucosamine-6-phosphate deaminase